MKFSLSILFLVFTLSAQTGFSQTNNDHIISLKQVTGGVGGSCLGMCGYFTAEIKVKNISYSKKVGISYRILGRDGNPLPLDLAPWYVAQGRYVPGSLNDHGEEIWKVEFQTGASRNFKMEFALFYENEGVTYWNNNSMKNYKWDNEAREMLVP